MPDFTAALRGVIQAGRGGGVRAAARARLVHLPDDLVAAFAAASVAGEPELIRRFYALSFTNRRELAAWIEEAKRPATRAARVAQTLDRLRTLR